MKKIVFPMLAVLMSSCSISRHQASKLQPPTIVVDGHTYTLSPSSIRMTITEGGPDRSFYFSIAPDAFIDYGFSVYGYGVGFPTYGLLADESSGGTRGTKFIHVRVNAGSLPLNYDGKKKTYSGYLPIHIFQGSETGRDTNFLKLPVTVTVVRKSHT